MRGNLRILTILGLACLLLIGAESIASAQGRGRGGGGGMGGGRGSGGPGMGDSRGGGRPDGIGVDRGVNTSSERSGGRADRGRDRASDRSGGRSDEGLGRARLRRENARRADDELRERPEMAERLHTTANDLRAGYQSALASNPNLKFGQYVAATRLAANLGTRYPNVTTAAILAGLATGDSIGETLRDLGVSDRDAREARRQTDREIREARRRP